jgi:hypothetical protein
MLIDILPSVETHLRTQRAANTDFVVQVNHGLCALSNLFDPLVGSVNGPRSLDSRQVTNLQDPRHMLVTACIQLIESGGMESLIRIALLPMDGMAGYGPLGISSMDLLAEASQSICFLSPLLLSNEISSRKLSCWAYDAFLTFEYLLHVASASRNKDYRDHVSDVRLSALQGISTLAESEPLKIRIVDRLLTQLLEANNSQEHREISNASTQALQSLHLAEDEAAYQIVGKSPSLLADWFCLQRSLLVQAMACREIRDAVLNIWELPLSENSPGTGPTKLIREVSDRSKSDDDQSIGNYFFHNMVSDDSMSKRIEGILEQYDQMFGPHQSQGSHRALLDEMSASLLSTSTGFLHSQIYPLGSTATETDWLLRHYSYLQSPPRQFTSLTEHVETLLGVCFPSQLIRDMAIPVKELRPEAAFEFRAIMMPQRRYFSFRREGQLLTRICGKDDGLTSVPWVLGFTNSSFAGEFAESLSQALYLCPLISGLSFVRDHHWYTIKKTQQDEDTSPEDGIRYIPNIVGLLPPWITNLTFDGLLGEKEVRSLIKILAQIGKVSEDQEKRGMVQSFRGLGNRIHETHGQERFWCIAIRNSPHISVETWCELFGLLGRAGRNLESISPRPLASLKALDLSGNGLNDDTCAALLEIVLNKDSGCSVEQLDLSHNRLANATQTIKALKTYVHLHRADYARGIKKRSPPGWKTPLDTLLLASAGLHLGGAWLEIVTLLKNNALSLKRLDLSSNGIMLKGDSYESELFISALERNTCLVHLSLSENKLSSDTIDLLISRLNQSANPKLALSFLDLVRNQPSLSIQQEEAIKRLLLKTRSNLVQRLIHSDSATEPPSTFGTELSTAEPGDNKITVLFSEPLVFLDGRRGVKPFGKLDFEMEREIVLNCLKEASRDIDLRFDTATHQRLLAAVAKGCKCLHYSGHGHGDFLPFEDGVGGPHWLSIEDIRSLMTGREGSTPFRFVFVSACHSGKAGETFAAAGVPHVVCCKQEFEMKDTAALAFTRQFYLALAVGHTVREAFEQGRKAVKALPGLGNAEFETEKFDLLPRDGNHDVPIFDARPTLQWHHAQSYRKKKYKGKANLSMFNKLQEDPSTSPPQFFLGREIDLFLVLNKVMSNRLVSITGEAGIGRSSLACALCHYINERASIMSHIFSNILYVRARQTRKQSRIRVLIQKLLKKMVDNNMLDPEDGDPEPDADVESLFDLVCKQLREAKCLIVFDRTELLKDSDETQEFPMFLDKLFRETRNVRVLLTSLETMGIAAIGGQMEQHYKLGPLSFGNTVRLFGNLCPYIHTLDERKNLFRSLVSSEDEDDNERETVMTDLDKQLYALFGAGIPAKVEKAAYVIGKDDVLVLMSGAGIEALLERHDVSPVEVEVPQWIARGDDTIND